MVLLGVENGFRQHTLELGFWVENLEIVAKEGPN